MTESTRIGLLGEELTAIEYRKKGYIIYTAHYNTRFGELDLVALKGKTLAVCEVKTRKEGSPISGREAVDTTKQRKIIAATQQFIQSEKINQDILIRFDVSEVIYKNDDDFNITIIKNAFTL